jgi:hypothetical protein
VWFWIADGAMSLLGLALIVAGLTAKTPARLNWLWQRARLCALIAGLGALALAAVSAIRLSGAVGGTSSDPSQSARIMATDISGAIDGFAAALLLTPLPFIALIVVWVRRNKLARR